MAITVEIKRVSKNYGKKAALQAVSLRVDAGTSLGLVGPNGAGKSTLMRVLLGICRPDTGNVWFDGVPLWPAPERVMVRVGGFVDLPRFYPYLSGRENLALLADVTGQPKGRVDEVLDLVRLTPFQNDRSGGYSHGMRQRLGLAAALLKRPALIVLDEPHDGLDPARQEEMCRLINAIRGELGATFIISSHVMADIERLCDQIAVFDAGRLRYAGPPAKLGGPADDEIVWEVSPVDTALGYLRSLGLWARLTPEGVAAAPWDDALDLAEVNQGLMQRGVLVRTVVRRRASLQARLMRYLEVGHVDVR